MKRELFKKLFVLGVLLISLNACNCNKNAENCDKNTTCKNKKRDEVF